MGIKFSNKKEWTDNNIEVFQNHEVKWKNPYIRVRTAWSHLYEVLQQAKLTYSGKSGCFLGEKSRGPSGKEH